MSKQKLKMCWVTLFLYCSLYDILLEILLLILAIFFHPAYHVHGFLFPDPNFTALLVFNILPRPDYHGQGHHVGMSN